MVLLTHNKRVGDKRFISAALRSPLLCPHQVDIHRKIRTNTSVGNEDGTPPKLKSDETADDADHTQPSYESPAVGDWAAESKKEKHQK